MEFNNWSLKIKMESIYYTYIICPYTFQNVGGNIGGTIKTLATTIELYTFHVLF